MNTESRLLLVVADGVRPDALAEEMSAGRAPALASLRDRGGLHTVTASFPSVTGPAYVPFVMGRQPAHVGLPGLRWFDRSRTLRWCPTRSRSYAGLDIWHVDRDVSPEAPTLFELARPSLAGMSMLARGATHGRVGRSVAWMLRAAPVHFRGDLSGWRKLEIAAIEQFLRRFARVRPRASLLAVVSADKFAHAYGTHSEPVRAAIADVDLAVARAQAIADRDGWGATLRIWVIGDHGHAPVERHDDLHGWLESQGLRVLAHPRLLVRRPDVALMVGGNAMAHVYLSPGERARRWWPAHESRGQALLEGLLARESIDLAITGRAPDTVEVWSATRGMARIHRTAGTHAARWSYLPCTGDPLDLGGAHRGLDADAAWQATAVTPYPDAVVQLASLATSPRAGDIVLSAADGWDLRARFEPIAHRSTHGALLREQMEVPLLLDAPPVRPPQRTTDVVPSALDALGIAPAHPFDGRSFLRAG